MADTPRVMAHQRTRCALRAADNVHGAGICQRWRPHLLRTEPARRVSTLIAAPGAGIRTRYLEVGFGRHPSFSTLSRVCRKIDRAVGATLDKGVHIRRMRRGVRASDGPLVAARR